MNAWTVAFFVLLAFHLARERLIYWQRRHIEALKEAIHLDDMEAALDRAHWWNQGAKAERRRWEP